MQSTYSLEKTLMLGKIEGGEGDDRGQAGNTDSMDTSLSKLWVMVKDREAWCPSVNDVTKSGHDWVS